MAIKGERRPETMKISGVRSREWGLRIADCGLIKLSVPISRSRLNKFINPQSAIRNPQSPLPISFRGEQDEKDSDYIVDPSAVCAGRRAIRRDGATVDSISQYQKSRSRRHLSRDRSRRSIPMARRRQLRGDRQVGRGGEQSDLRVPGKDPVPREDQGAVGTTLQLPEDQRAVPQRRPLFLLQERRAAEPERALRSDGAGGKAGGVDRSEQVF